MSMQGCGTVSEWGYIRQSLRCGSGVGSDPGGPIRGGFASANTRGEQQADSDKSGCFHSVYQIRVLELCQNSVHRVRRQGSCLAH
jgi:hypothetical protein